MLKKLSFILSALFFAVLFMCSSMSVFAIGPSQDGIYEVPVEMWHAKKEKTSMGDKYILHTALLTVKDGNKTLTIVPTETSSDMQFWYYKDGSVSGDTVEIKPTVNVEIAGTKYSTAFEFPVKSSNEFVGVKFAASIMPVSPSARIKIDYSGAKKVGDVENKTTAKANVKTTAMQTTKPVSTVTVENTTEVITKNATDQTTEAVTVADSQMIGDVTTTTAVEESTAESANEAESKTDSKTPVIIGIVVGIVVIGAIITIIIKKKSK